MQIPKFVDIDKILKTKSPKLYRFLPRFLINYVIKKLHQDAINLGIHLNKDKFGHDFNNGCLEYVGAKVKISGEENIPKSGPVIVASNHPMGGLDGMAVTHAVSKVRTDTVFFVNDILKNLKNYANLFVGVSKLGTTSSTALKAVVDEYSTNKAVLVFPAGLVSRKQGKLIRDTEWKKSFVSKSVQYNNLIIPAFVNGENSKFFYNVAMWRKRFGIKTNIEMFFLPDEMFSSSNKEMHIHFGKPISPSLFTSDKTHLQWAQKIKEFVYSKNFLSGESFEDFLRHS